MRTDEEGKSARVRRPLIGFKRCEVALDIDGINNGLCDARMGILTWDFMMGVGMGMLEFVYRMFLRRSGYSSR
jgi:hypothetical protein